MSFLNVLKSTKIKELTEEKLIESDKSIEEAQKKPEEVLRGAGFKIKLVTPTSFGTQIDFAKQYDPKEIEKALTGFTIKLKNKSVFIVD